MDLDGGVCVELPLEIIERVLSFLPVHDLCRFRSVSKGWNELLCKPSFHDLCDLNGKDDRYLFVTRDLDCDGWSVVDPIFRRTMSFLDLDEKRWYSIEAGESLGVLDEEFHEPQLSAMDDGLVCEMSTLRGSDDDLALAIYDPVAKSSTTLPAPAEIFCLGAYLPIILPAVDYMPRSYKVFLVKNPREYSRGVVRTRVHVYETLSNEWRGLRNPPKEFEGLIAGSAVILQDVLYIIFRDIPRWQFVLLSYKLQEDVWIQVRRISCPRKPRHPQLVVRGNRLFLNVWSGGTFSSMEGFSMFEMIEILLADNTSRIIVQFTVAQLQQFFGEQDSGFNIAYGVPCFNSNGLCNSIVLMSSLSGKLVTFDLMRGTADVLPTNPLIQGSYKESYPDYGMYRGRNMILSLRNLLSQDTVTSGTCMKSFMR